MNATNAKAPRADIDTILEEAEARYRATKQPLRPIKADFNAEQYWIGRIHGMREAARIMEACARFDHSLESTARTVDGLSTEMLIALVHWPDHLAGWIVESDAVDLSLEFREDEDESES